MGGMLATEPDCVTCSRDPEGVVETGLEEIESLFGDVALVPATPTDCGSRRMIEKIIVVERGRLARESIMVKI